MNEGQYPVSDAQLCRHCRQHKTRPVHDFGGVGYSHPFWDAVSYWPQLDEAMRQRIRNGEFDKPVIAAARLE